MANQFVGFGTSTDWIAEVDKSFPVNAECVAEGGKGDRYGIRLTTQYIVLSQVKGSEVLYCLVPVDRYQTMDFHPMFDEEKHVARAKTAFDITLAWLEQNGIRPRRSIVAMPRSLKKLEGVAEYMRYDKESDTYKAWGE